MKIINWYRVKRTAIQVGSGAAAAFLTGLLTDSTVQGIKYGALVFVVTVGFAIFMNIKEQAEHSPETDGK